MRLEHQINLQKSDYLPDAGARLESLSRACEGAVTFHDEWSRRFTAAANEPVSEMGSAGVSPAVFGVSPNTRRGAPGWCRTARRRPVQPGRPRSPSKHLRSMGIITSGLAAIALALAFFQASARAEDWTTTSGRVLRDIEVSELVGDSITIKHREGVSRILLSELPAEIQSRFSAPTLWKELRLRNAEILKLKSDLAAAHGKAETLARTAELSAASGDSVPARTPAKLMPPIASLPPLDASAAVPADEIAHYYKADPRSADARYGRKTFRVQGKIERFDEKAFVRKTIVILESPERSHRVVCELPFPDEFNAVYAKQGGQVLVGITSSRREVRLMEVGETVILEGRCTGVQSSGILFSRCQRVQ